jgi:hypothetical protein
MLGVAQSTNEDFLWHSLRAVLYRQVLVHDPPHCQLLGVLLMQTLIA